ncbi:MAG: GTPase [Bacilli bacterium]
MNRRCLGCGAIFQTEKPEVEGYVESSVYGKTSICRRCFRIKNYGDYVFIKKDNEEYIKILKYIKNTGDLVLYVVDFFNINLSIKEIGKYLNNPLILILNKKDLLPKAINLKRIKETIKKEKLNLIDILVVSSINNDEFNTLYKIIRKNQQSKNVYVVGNTNAGKSTLINKLMKTFSSSKTYITTSPLPSTTVDMMEIKINDRLTLIDTPGLLDESNVSNVLDFMTLKRVLPKKEIKPRTYQLKEGESLLIDNLVRLDYIEGKRNSFTVYISNEVTIEHFKIDSSDKLQREIRYQFFIEGEEDIVINGLCFIKVSLPGKINLYTKPKIGVFKRDKLI